MIVKLQRSSQENKRNGFRVARFNCVVDVVIEVEEGKRKHLLLGSKSRSSMAMSPL